MKILITYLSVFLFIFSHKTMANNNISHAIAMHGEPKYEKDFLSVEYVSNSAVKGGNIVRGAFGSYDSFHPFILTINLLCFFHLLAFHYLMNFSYISRILHFFK